MDEKELQSAIISNDYFDIILNFKTTPETWTEEFREYGAQTFGGGFGMVHVPSQFLPENPMKITGYYSVPKLYATLDTASLEASGILKLQAQPILRYKGKNVILGFIDTGIDYNLPVFRRSDGRTRILRIWDQSLQSGIPPTDIFYGSEYTEAQINEALSSQEPYSVVPSRDENGHGTRLAGIAAGSPDADFDFTGAAPEADIAVVKLKPAKQNLQDFYLTRSASAVFQETDIMMAVRYLLDVSRALEKPLVICLGLGTNQGSHTGYSPLSRVLSYYAGFAGCYIVTAAGNEAGNAHHYYGRMDADQPSDDVEILVDSRDEGFSLELWAQPPELYSVGIISPLGETIAQIPARLDQSATLRFTLERTVIELCYEIVETTTGNELILLRFKNPTPGIWTVRVFNEIYTNGIFHMWLPVTGLVSPGTVFLAPNPDTTLTAPSDSDDVITVSAYSAYNGSLYINSSRGYTGDGKIKPDIAAPGVDVTAPEAGGGYGRYTGSSAAAAITAGAAALLVNWGGDNIPESYLTNAQMRSFLIRGASRNPQFTYPNREWGYGTLNLYQFY